MGLMNMWSAPPCLGLLGGRLTQRTCSSHTRASWMPVEHVGWRGFGASKRRGPSTSTVAGSAVVSSEALIHHLAVLQARAPHTPRVVRSVRVRAASADAGDGLAPTRVLTGAAWAAFIGYAALVAPKSAPEVDAALVTQLITLPFSGAANYLFEAQFNALGVMPAVYASLLMPGT